MKKFLSVLLVFSIISSMTFIVNIGVYAEQSGDFTFTVNESNATITAYSGTGGVIVIPETLGGYTVTEIGQSAFKDNATINEVTLPNSLKRLGHFSFQNCSELTKVTIGTGLNYIGAWVFNDCLKLSDIEVNINNLNYSSFNGAIYNKNQTWILLCPVGKTGTYTVPNTVTNISGNAFSRCALLTQIIIGTGVTSIGDNAFTLCGGLTEISIPDNVTSIGSYVFSLCSNLANVTFGSGISNIGDNLFVESPKLAQINVSNDNANFSSEDGVLLNKAKTEIVIFPPSKTGNYIIPNTMTSIADNAFSSCALLTEITVPDSVITIGENAFYGCAELVGVNIGKGVTSIAQNAFNYCNKLTNINVDIENTVYSSRNGDLLNKAKTSLLRCPQGKKGMYIVASTITLIKSLAFNDCYLITEMIIPQGVTKIETLAFNECRSLDKITVSSKNKYYSSSKNLLFNKSGKTLLFCTKGFKDNFSVPYGVSIIGKYAFNNCDYIKTITLPYGVSIIGENAFSECNVLTKVIIPESVTTISSNAFATCLDLVDAYFLGNAPKMGTDVFKNSSPTFKITHFTNKTGYTNPWNSYTTVGRKFTYVKSVKISRTTLSLRRGRTYKLVATIGPLNASNKRVIWKSANKSIATVSRTGYVKGIKRGITYIYVHTADKNKVARCKVTIK